jgi:SUMO ligase MMS21 Smc5/6 complex component
MKEVLLSKIVLEKIEKQQNKHATITQQHQQQREEKRERREEKRREKRRKSISIMSPIWKEPTSKSAFILSWFSVILTLIFATIGIVYYNVS